MDAAVPIKHAASNSPGYSLLRKSSTPLQHTSSTCPAEPPLSTLDAAMASTSAPRVTAEKLGPVEGLAEKMTFTSIQTGGPAGDGLQRNSLSRHDYGPSSPCSPHSPRVGEVWRTGQASSHGTWFRPSPTKKQGMQ
ncbi:hypothetical protein ABPG75_011453 [Micractinium tetrahymenae]